MTTLPINNTKLQFSGHESFACKQFWLKKGFDFVIDQKSFNDNTAVVDLGVGKNMVNSIRHWCKSFNITKDEDDSTTTFGEYILSNVGKDPYLEDIGTLWLLHYNLIKRNKASIYSLVFNEFRKERLDFTKDHLNSFLRRKCNEDPSFKYNENTINTDINVFFRNYSHPGKKIKSEIEDLFSNIFLDLNLIFQSKKRSLGEDLTDWYRIENSSQEGLPFEIVLFSILDNFENIQSISFRQLLSGLNSPGNIFVLTAEGLYNKIMQITDKYEDIVYSETAGNQVLQLKKNINKWEVLNEYYN